MKLIYNDFRDEDGFKQKNKTTFLNWYGGALRAFFDDPKAKDYLNMNNFDALAYLWVEKHKSWVLNVLFYFLVNMCNIPAIIDKKTFINIKINYPNFINDYDDPDNPYYPFLIL